MIEKAETFFVATRPLANPWAVGWLSFGSDKAVFKWKLNRQGPHELSCCLFVLLPTVLGFWISMFLFAGRSPFLWFLWDG